MKKTLIILVLFFASGLNAKDTTNYSCTFKDIPQPTTLVFPESIQLSVDFNDQSINVYIEDGVNLTKKYECYKCVSDEQRVEVKLKNYDPWGNSKDDTDNARVFEIYSSDLVGHLWKPFVPGINYQCIKY